ncbi:MAG TPA: hypothetical protein EYN66_14625, partial [Myxococcales bacterium]|nr:hypothetical protein [Myxococcales bacterium]
MRISFSIVTVVLALLITVPASAAWQTVFSESFDSNSNSFSGTNGWKSNYCFDAWSTNGPKGVWPKRDDGCDGGICNCEFGITGTCNQFINNSDAYDDLLH